MLSRRSLEELARDVESVYIVMGECEQGESNEQNRMSPRLLKLDDYDAILHRSRPRYSPKPFHISINSHRRGRQLLCNRGATEWSIDPISTSEDGRIGDGLTCSNCATYEPGTSTSGA